MPGEIVDLRIFKRSVKPVLDVHDWLARLAAAFVGEHVGAIGNPLRVECLQRCEDGRVERQGVWPAAFGTRNPQNLVQEVDVLPLVA